MMRPGGAGARAAIRRKHHATKQEKVEEGMHQIMNKYDYNNNGILEPDQLRDFLKDMNDGQEPTEDEVRFVLVTCKSLDKEHHKDSVGGVSVKELPLAISIWRGYREDAEWIDSIFDKYDSDKTGQLEFADLKKLMQDLSEGDPTPSDEDVKRVLLQADMKDGRASGGVSRIELRSAVLMWLHMLEHDEKDKDKHHHTHDHKHDHDSDDEKKKKDDHHDRKEDHHEKKEEKKEERHEKREEKKEDHQEKKEEKKEDRHEKREEKKEDRQEKKEEKHEKKEEAKKSSLCLIL